MELRSKDIFNVKIYREGRKPFPGSSALSLIGDIAPVISTAVEAALSAVGSAISGVGAVLAKRGLRPRGERKEIFRRALGQGLRILEVEIEGGAARIEDSERPELVIYGQNSECDEGGCDVEASDEKLSVSLSGCAAEIGIPEKELEKIQVEVLGGYLEIRHSSGARRASAEISGGAAGIRVGNLGESETRISLRGGAAALEISYREYSGMAVLEIETGGGLASCTAKIPRGTLVQRSEERLGGVIRMSIPEDLQEKGEAKRILAVRTSTLGGLADIKLLPAGS